MNVHWTDTALRHLDAIHRFIVYYIKPSQIDVLAVIHGAQDIPQSQ